MEVISRTAEESDPKTEGGDAPTVGRLPESCVSHALSLTSPRDACRAAPTSFAFRRAADADTVWGRFFSPDLLSILSRAADPASLAALSKKELYFHVRSNPVLIDGGKMSFQLERTTEKKHFMVSARGLEIIDGDKPQRFKWSPANDSRFSEVVELVDVVHLEIHAKIDAGILSPGTTYTVFLIFKIASNSSGLDSLTRATISLEKRKKPNDRPFTALTWLFGFMDDAADWKEEELLGAGLGEPWLVSAMGNFYMTGDAKKEAVVGDGWLELELGRFAVKDGKEGEVDVCVLESRSGWPKMGLVVYGVELRPNRPKAAK